MVSTLVWSESSLLSDDIECKGEEGEAEEGEEDETASWLQQLRIP